MSALSFLAARRIEVACTVRISHRFEELSAHVELDGEVKIEPGDSVLVHGAEMKARYGEVLVERRRATVTRATWLERAWTRATGDLECLSLLEVSFSETRSL